MEREGYGVFSLSHDESISSPSPHLLPPRDERAGLTVPLRLLTSNSSPSLSVSAGKLTAGPRSVPSCALRNWQTMVWTGWEEASFAASEAADGGPVVRARLGGGGMTVLIVPELGEVSEVLSESELSLGETQAPKVKEWRC